MTLTYMTRQRAQHRRSTAEAMIEGVRGRQPRHQDRVSRSRPGGTDGDNIIKTRLATGEMTDVFRYNTGSLFQAINPTDQSAST